MKSSIASLMAAAIVVAAWLPGAAQAHCEIPCGIYDDESRVERIYEHTETIEKSMNTIIELRGEKEKNYNQLVRWINNKELHADKIQRIVYQYFMTQRITPVEQEKKDAYTKYEHELMLLHRMLVQAMKCKQSTDTAHVTALREALKAFRKSYFEAHPHEHE